MLTNKETVTLGDIFSFMDELLLLLESLHNRLQESEENERKLMMTNLDLMSENMELTEYNDSLTKLIKECIDGTKLIQ